MATIHRTAIVDSHAELDSTVEVGPFCVISGEVRLGEGVRLVSGVTIQGPVEVGAGTTLYPGVCVGLPPQDFKFALGSPTAGVRIGRDCAIREHVTIHAASKTDRATTIGDHVFMMVNSHAGHDVQVGDRVILTNGVLLAGHSVVQDRAILSGNVCLHQFGRVGRLAFASGGALITGELPPYCICRGRNSMVGINIVGMRRAGIPSLQISATRRAFREILRPVLSREEQLARLDELAAGCPPLADIAEFIRTAKRPVAHTELRPPGAFRAWMRAIEGGTLEHDLEEQID